LTFAVPPAPVATLTSVISAFPLASHRPKTTLLVVSFQAVAKVEPTPTTAARPRAVRVESGDLLAASAPVPSKIRA
jgi:hypothetical protein